MYVGMYVCICLCISISLYLNIYLSLSLYTPNRPTPTPPVRSTPHLSIYIYPYACMYVCISIYLSIYLYLSLSKPLSLSLSKPLSLSIYISNCTYRAVRLRFLSYDRLLWRVALVEADPSVQLDQVDAPQVVQGDLCALLWLKQPT